MEAPYIGVAAVDGEVERCCDAVRAVRELVGVDRQQPAPRSHGGAAVSEVGRALYGDAVGHAVDDQLDEMFAAVDVRRRVDRHIDGEAVRAACAHRHRRAAQRDRAAVDSYVTGIDGLHSRRVCHRFEGNAVVCIARYRRHGGGGRVRALAGVCLVGHGVFDGECISRARIFRVSFDEDRIDVFAVGGCYLIETAVFRDLACV